MRQHWIGMATAALLLGSAGSALANQEQKGTSTQGSTQYQTQEHQKKQASAKAEHRLSGKVAAIKGDMLYLNREEAIIPLKVTQSTQVEGKPLEKSESINSQLMRDFPVGEEVRASFKIEGQTENVAVKLDAAGMRHQGSQEGYQSQPSSQPSGNPSQGK